MTIKEFTGPVRGVGKPDYSKEVASSRDRRGLRLAYKQSLTIAGIVFSVIPSPFAWVTAPLAPGVTAHLIDNLTGLPLPLTVPEGYTMTFIAGGLGFTQDSITHLYFDGFLVMSGGVGTGGKTIYENYIVGISTATIDPTGASPHTLDVTVTNLGGANLEGGVDWTGILEGVGTPPLPLVKVIKCKYCEHKETVPVEQTKLVCPECGKLTLVYDLRHFRKTP